MTYVVLIRHGECDGIGETLWGRQGGVGLNYSGRQSAERLADRLVVKNIAVVYSSPLERAQETASLIARRINVEVCVRDNLNEIDYGEWTGKRIGELKNEEEWQQFNTVRSAGCPPKGESMASVQSRIVRELCELVSATCGEAIAVVTHSDVIKAALIHFLNMNLDDIHRLEISPCSQSVLQLNTNDVKLLAMNIGYV
jgi:probable phosphoglycerate mutase